MEDGSWHHRIRQSWLKTADLCPEQARLEHAGLLRDEETDAANVGTAVHAAIELALLSDRAVTKDEGIAAFLGKYEQLEASPVFRYVKYTKKSARAFGALCVEQFFLHAAHDIPTVAQGAELEKRFLVPLFEDADRSVELSGTIDYLGPTSLYARTKDWKTSSRGEYGRWEKQRWDVQSTCYTLALNRLGIIDQPSIPFEFVVMHDDGVQRLVVQRDARDWSWLQDKVMSLCLLIEADVPTWPKQDNHALCGPKWCAAWESCKGSHGIEF